MFAALVLKATLSRLNAPCSLKAARISLTGTIDKCYPRATGGYSFEIGDSYAWGLIENFARPGRRFVSFSRQDSQDVTEEDRKKLADLIAAAPEEKVLVSSCKKIKTAKRLGDVERMDVSNFFLSALSS